MPTPHNAAKKGEIAKTVLMPGDPNRAKMIAETYLSDVKLVSDIRGIGCYTGTYKGKELSVMASGMGMPSVGIYSYELFTEYDVENIIRIGTAGAYKPELDLNDVVLAESAYSESSYGKTQSGDESDIKYPDAALNEKILAAAKTMGVEILLSRIHSSDVFYRMGSNDYVSVLADELGCACVEMESFALFHNAKVLGKKAACIVTISDSLVKPGILTPEERQEKLHTMIKIALEAAISG